MEEILYINMVIGETYWYRIDKTFMATYTAKFEDSVFLQVIHPKDTYFYILMSTFNVKIYKKSNVYNRIFKVVLSQLFDIHTTAIVCNGYF